MTLQQFITDYQRPIDAFILEHSHCGAVDDTEREVWVLFDPTLYQWAEIECEDLD